MQEERAPETSWSRLTEDSLDRFFREYFVETTSAGTRRSSVNLLRSLWHAADDQQKQKYVGELDQLSGRILETGSLSDSYFQLLKHMVPSMSQPRN